MTSKEQPVHDHDPEGQCHILCPAYIHRDNVRRTRVGQWRQAEETRRQEAAPIVGGPLMSCQ